MASVDLGSVLPTLRIVLYVLAGGALAFALAFYLKFNKKVLVVERNQKRILVRKARQYKEEGVYKWQMWGLMNGEWHKLAAPTKDQQFTHQGKDCVVVERKGTSAYIILSLGDDIIKQIPNESYLFWDYQEREKDHERLIARKSNQQVIALTLFIVCIVAVLIIFIIYSEHMKAMIANMQSTAQMQFDLNKCAQSTTNLQANNSIAPINPFGIGIK